MVRNLIPAITTFFNIVYAALYADIPLLFIRFNAGGYNGVMIQNDNCDTIGLSLTIS